VSVQCSEHELQFGLETILSMKMRDFWSTGPRSIVEVDQLPEVRNASIIRKTPRSNPEGSHPHTCRRENLKSHYIQ
jgi:hypothetical protein